MASGLDDWSPDDVPPDPAVERCQEAAFLGGDTRRQAVHELLLHLGDADPLVRWQAQAALYTTTIVLQDRARMGASPWRDDSTEYTFDALLSAMRIGLQDADPIRRASTAEALSFWDYARVPSMIVALLGDAEASVRASAASALGRLSDQDTASALASALDDPSIWVRKAVADALGAIASTRGIAGLCRSASDDSALVRASAINALGRVSSTRSRDELARAVYDPDPGVRWFAARGLVEIGDVTSLPALQELRRDEATAFGRMIGNVARAAMSAIRARDRGLGSVLRRAGAYLRHRRRRHGLREGVGAS